MGTAWGTIGTAWVQHILYRNSVRLGQHGNSTYGHHGNLERIFREKREGRNMVSFWAEGYMNAEGERLGKKLEIFCGREQKKRFFIAVHTVCCMRGRERK